MRRPPAGALRPWLVLLAQGAPVGGLNASAGRGLPRHTISGQSSGASFAIQHLFAFSGSVRGAGLAAGSPYGCGLTRGGRMPRGRCYYGGVDVDFTMEYIGWRFSQGVIDDPKNLSSVPVLLFNGRNDYVVYVKVMRETHRQLRAFVAPELLGSNFETGASHVWSLDHGRCRCGACAHGGREECCDVNNCGYDLSGDMLSRFYGPLRERVPARRYLSWIWQADYVPSGRARDHGLKNWAAAYVPTGCQGDPGACRLHVHYHGCIVGNEGRLEWMSLIDLNEYAEANDIVVVYPQARGDSVVGHGCWNWGFPEDDPWFDTADGAQLRTVASLIRDLPNALPGALELPVGSEPPREGALPGALELPVGSEPPRETERGAPLEPAAGAAGAAELLV